MLPKCFLSGEFLSLCPLKTWDMLSTLFCTQWAPMWSLSWCALLNPSFHLQISFLWSLMWKLPTPPHKSPPRPFVETRRVGGETDLKTGEKFPVPQVPAAPKAPHSALAIGLGCLARVSGKTHFLLLHLLPARLVTDPDSLHMWSFLFRKLMVFSGSKSQLVALCRRWKTWPAPAARQPLEN